MGKYNSIKRTNLSKSKSSLSLVLLLIFRMRDSKTLRIKRIMRSLGWWALIRVKY